jgi:hypothetical protein
MALSPRIKVLCTAFHVKGILVRVRTLLVVAN